MNFGSKAKTGKWKRALVTFIKKNKKFKNQNKKFKKSNKH